MARMEGWRIGGKCSGDPWGGEPRDSNGSEKGTSEASKGEAGIRSARAGGGLEIKRLWYLLSSKENGVKSILEMKNEETVFRHVFEMSCVSILEDSMEGCVTGGGKRFRPGSARAKRPRRAQEEGATKAGLY